MVNDYVGSPQRASSSSNDFRTRLSALGQRLSLMNEQAEGVLGRLIGVENHPKGPQVTGQSGELPVGRHLDTLENLSEELGKRLSQIMGII